MLNRNYHDTRPKLERTFSMFLFSSFNRKICRRTSYAESYAYHQFIKKNEQFWNESTAAHIDNMSSKSIARFWNRGNENTWSIMARSISTTLWNERRMCAGETEFWSTGSGHAIRFKSLLIIYYKYVELWISENFQSNNTLNDWLLYETVPHWNERPSYGICCQFKSATAN